MKRIDGSVGDEESGTAMPGLSVQMEGGPGADEIRAALQRMAKSEAFRGSPQLVSFLRYVVEATLRGAADRIKGYTIAVEALGRADDFDPQADPIVRVEAMRLRRALGRYYANGGKHDPLAIDLPLGSYVPVFRHVEPPAPEAAAVPPPETRAVPLRERSRAPRVRWRSVAAGIAFLLSGAALYAGFDFWLDFTPAPRVMADAVPAASGPEWRSPASYPIVFVGPSQGAVATGTDAPAADALRGKLRDALARFDEIQVVAAPPPKPDASFAESEKAEARRYSLTTSVHPEGVGTTRIDVRRARCARRPRCLRPRLRAVAAPRRADTERGGDRARGGGSAGTAVRDHPSLRTRQDPIGREPLRLSD